MRTDVADLKRCEYVLPLKKRRCRLLARADRRFCGEHCAFDESDDRDRVLCPLDPKHTVTRCELAEHLANRCNSRVALCEPWIAINCNRANAHAIQGERSANDSCPPSATKDDYRTRIADVVRKIECIYEEIASRVQIAILHTQIVDDEIASGNPGETRRKHLVQQSSIIGHLVSAGLLADAADSCVIELGAGKAQLTYWMAKLAPACRFLLVDRAGSRNKHDNKAKLENKNLRIDRLRCSIEHLDLANVETLANCKSIVATWKHFCGDATDFGIRCLEKALQKLPVIGFAIAPCCCHKSTFEEYVGHAFLASCGIRDAGDFAALRHIATWAACGFRSEHGDCDDTIREQATATDGDDFANWSSERKETVGRKAKVLFEFGRARYLEEKLGFCVTLFRYVDFPVSPENLLIVGTRKEK